MNGPVTWEVLQWLIGGAIAIIAATAGISGGGMWWLAGQFRKARHARDNQTQEVLNTIEVLGADLRREFTEFKDAVRLDQGKLREEMNTRFVALTNETHEQNAQLRERVATVETILARLPRA